MIRMIQSSSAKQAKAYFNDSLQRSDYYLDKQEVVGLEFHGKISERLGVMGNSSKEIFHMLIENIHPVTGENLTARKVDNRTIGYDIGFHCPKSVSLLHVLSKDDHILEVFKQSVNETMHDIERDSLVRVRKNNNDENRKSGELVWAEFIHLTSRPVKDKNPDPHLHSHCYTFNVAWDNVEQQFKAGQFQAIKRDMPYYQARFHKRLSDNLIMLGYRIKRSKTAFEVIGVPQTAIDLFSKRKHDIEMTAKENNITNAKDLDQLGSRTRAKKQKGLSMSQLINDWRKQIVDLGMNSEEANGTIIRHKDILDTYDTNPLQSVAYAIDHRFERASVFQDRRILETAYRFAIGNHSSSVQKIDEAFLFNANIIQVHDEDITLCTTHQTLDAEKTLISLAVQGKNKFQPFYKKPPTIELTGDQGLAVQSILTTKDQTSIIEGRAGTGKTTLMKEAVSMIEKCGKKVTVVAPTSQAARSVLKEEGFEHSETVAQLLSERNLQDDLQDNVLWVDEAGLLGINDLLALLKLVIAKNARLILGGDSKQHSSVAFGDGLRLLGVFAGLNTMQVNTIYRQSTIQYRESVQAISDGNIDEGFQKLDALGSIIEVDPNSPESILIQDYLLSTSKGNSALIISPTHHQGERITTELRQAMKSSGIIGDIDYAAKRLVNMNFTEAEKRDTRNYTPGLILQFNQNQKQIKRGSRWRVETVQSDRLMITDKNQAIELCLEKKKNDFDVFEQKVIPLAVNDIIRITRNSFDSNKKRLNNGQDFKVLKVDTEKSVTILNIKNQSQSIIDINFGHIAHGYCNTSHSSQGKTVDEVFVYQPSSTFVASDLKQFYVSVSRGRNMARVYTDDKEELLNCVSKTRTRRSAIELLNQNFKSFDATQKNEPNSGIDGITTYNNLDSPFPS